MKKIMIIDGSPRKNMNTAAMIEAFANGAKSVNEEIEVKTVRVYDMNCKGCVSCLACKLKNSKYLDVCAREQYDHAFPLHLSKEFLDGKEEVILWYARLFSLFLRLLLLSAYNQRQAFLPLQEWYGSP